MNPSSFLVFIIANLVGSLIPGPASLLSLKVGLENDWKKTLQSAAGLTLVGFAYALISLLGIGAAIVSSEYVYRGIKIAGALFMIYLGISTIMKSGKPIDTSSLDLPKENRKFLTGVGVGLGNPNAILFFIAIFPQLFDLKSFRTTDYVLCLGVLIVIIFLCMLLYSLVGTFILRLLKSRGKIRIMNIAMGLILTAIGCSLFL